MLGFGLKLGLFLGLGSSTTQDIRGSAVCICNVT